MTQVDELRQQLAASFELYYESVKDCGLGREDARVDWLEGIKSAGPLPRPSEPDEYEFGERMTILDLNRELDWFRRRAILLDYVATRLERESLKNPWLTTTRILMGTVKDLIGTVEAQSHFASNQARNQVLARTVAPKEMEG